MCTRDTDTCGYGLMGRSIINLEAATTKAELPLLSVKDNYTSKWLWNKDRALDFQRDHNCCTIKVNKMAFGKEISASLGDKYFFKGSEPERQGEI